MSAPAVTNRLQVVQKPAREKRQDTDNLIFCHSEPEETTNKGREKRE